MEGGWVRGRKGMRRNCCICERGVSCTSTLWGVSKMPVYVGIVCFSGDQGTAYVREAFPAFSLSEIWEQISVFTNPSVVNCFLTLCCSCRTFLYSMLTKGRPCPLHIVVYAVSFCSVNGFLQGHYMLHCSQYHSEWHKDTRLITGLLMFFTGMAINIHSDYILRNLRKPGEVSYKIPRGGMFELVSCANFFGEIVEWFGYAVATWSFPAFSFALFTFCSIGPRAYHHHRYYLEKFKDYPKSRKAVIPFLL
uniref:3-oxo-5alpha-steroid 4-dehydrogenase (NADP(+)) n=1 Tax=Cyprinus carpio carpio TaxID=630221 RepID=A0A9J7Z292_CYPCA